MTGRRVINWAEFETNEVRPGVFDLDASQQAEFIRQAAEPVPHSCGGAVVRGDVHTQCWGCGEHILGPWPPVSHG